MLHKSNVAEFATLVVNVRLLKMQPLKRLCALCAVCGRCDAVGAYDITPSDRRESDGDTLAEPADG